MQQSRPTNKTFISEAVNLGIISLIGYKPYSFLQEKNGAIVHEIAPSLKNLNSKSSNGIIEFDYHTDGAYLDRYIRPHILSLFCLRNESNTPTRLTRLGSIIDVLEEKHLFELMKSNYIHNPPETFSDTRKVKGPVLQLVDDKVEIAVSTHNVEPLTESAKKALLSLKDLAKELRVEITWNPGDMLIFNNLRCMHSRGQINGDRWLQRCYGSSNKDINRIIDLDIIF